MDFPFFLVYCFLRSFGCKDIVHFFVGIRNHELSGIRNASSLAMTIGSIGLACRGFWRYSYQRMGFLSHHLLAASAVMLTALNGHKLGMVSGEESQLLKHMISMDFTSR